MASKLALFTSLLLTSAALADPSSRLEARLARRRENRQPVPNDHVELLASDATPDVVYVTNWAGGVLKESNGTFTNVTGTFTVVTPSGTNGSAASAWVASAETPARTHSFRLASTLTLATTGVCLTTATWYQWYPASYSYDFTDITISADDVIKATVIALSTTSGLAIIENLTNGQTVTQKLNASIALCGANAQWIVEDFQEGGKNVPLANFGTVTFSNASASGPGGMYTPSDAVLVDMTQNNQILTSVSVTDSSVYVSYIL